MFVLLFVGSCLDDKIPNLFIYDNSGGTSFKVTFMFSVFAVLLS